MLTSTFSEFETDSGPLAYLNGYFLVGKLTRNGLTLNIETYGVRLADWLLFGLN